MKRILTAFYAKPLSLYLGVVLIVLSAFASPAEAMFLPAAPQAPGTIRVKSFSLHYCLDKYHDRQISRKKT